MGQPLQRVLRIAQRRAPRRKALGVLLFRAPFSVWLAHSHSTLNSISGGMSVYRSCSLQSHSFAGVGVCTHFRRNRAERAAFRQERGKASRLCIVRVRSLYRVRETQRNKDGNICESPRWLGVQIKRRTSTEHNIATTVSSRCAELYSNQKSVERSAKVTASCQTAADCPLATLTDKLKELTQTSGTVFSLPLSTFHSPWYFFIVLRPATAKS